jgi:hypothetical protein
LDRGLLYCIYSFIYSPEWAKRPFLENILAEGVDCVPEAARGAKLKIFGAAFFGV